MKPYYQDSACTIYHGDCRALLPDLPEPDAVICDPPYGIKHVSSHGASWEGTEIQNDGTTELRDWLWERFAALPRAMFGISWKQPPPRNVRMALIWDKGPAFGAGDLRIPWKPSWEEIYIAGDGWTGRRDEGVLRGPCIPSWEQGPAMDGRGRKHPHEKPVWLASRLIEKLPEASAILDPCMGTGFVLLAAKLLGKTAIGIEIEERYCEIAASRLSQGVLAL